MGLGLGISGAVNKLTALQAAVKFHNPQSAAVQHVAEERKRRSLLRYSCSRPGGLRCAYNYTMYVIGGPNKRAELCVWCF